MAADALLGTATWQPTLGTPGDYQLYAAWPLYTLLDPAATFSIINGQDTTEGTVGLSDPVYGLMWRSLGLFPLAANEDHWVVLEASATYETVADAIAVPDAIKLEATGAGTTPASCRMRVHGIS